MKPTPEHTSVETLEDLAAVLADSIADREHSEIIWQAFDEGVCSGDEEVVAATKRLRNLYVDLVEERASRHETDDRTGLLNQAGFERELGRRWSDRARYDREFGLIMIDLKGFKEINDDPARGYAVGDRILEEVGAILGDIRQGDLAFRRGGNGDEFMILTSLDDLTMLGQYVEHLRERFREVDTGTGPLEFKAGWVTTDLIQSHVPSGEVAGRLVALAERFMQIAALRDYQERLPALVRDRVG